MTKSIIEVSMVSKQFSGRQVYQSASATFLAGQATALVGPNGAGKSLLFRMICGFVRPDNGSIWIDPSFLSPHADFPERFGVVIDRPGFVNHQSGFRNLQQLAAIRNIIGEDDIRLSMRDVGLDPASSQRVANYSLGMRQRLALAQAFMERPEVLVLDEPFNALDVEMVDVLRLRLRAFRDSGGTLLFTSHNRDDIEAIADGVVEVKNQRLERSDS